MKDHRANVVVVMACLDSFNRHLRSYCETGAAEIRLQAIVD